MRIGAIPLALAVATMAHAQEPSACDLYFENTPATRITSVRIAPNLYNSFIGGGVIAHCRGQNNTIISDSAESYDALHLLYLIAHVHYREPRISVDSDHMTYYIAEGRLLAEQHVFAVMPSGSTMRGPWAEYLRVLPGIRTEAQLTAVQRPHLHLVQQDSTRPPPAVPPPYPRPDTSNTDTVGVDADRIFMQGDSLVYASGRVVTVRTDARTHSDSATFDTGREFSQLLRDPMIEGTQVNHPFTLRGTIIDIYSANHELQRVVAKEHGDGVSQDLHLVADTIDLRLIDRLLSRAYAWDDNVTNLFHPWTPDGRAHATTPVRDIFADSIDIRMPAQTVHQLHAVRRAYGTSVPDSTKIKSKERDWIKGDTLFAWFDTTQADPMPSTPPATPPGADSTTKASSEPQIKRLLSIGHARALYQLPPKDTSLHRPALNYVRGRTVTIDFDDGEVHTVTVVDSAAGLYLEPQADTLKADSVRVAKRAAADSIRAARRHARHSKGGAPADTATVPAAAPVDTAKAPAAAPAPAP